MKIRDLIDIIEKNEEWKRRQERVNSNLYYFDSSEKHIVQENFYDSYNKWLNQDIEAIHDNDVDDATHATNMRILNLLRAYLDKNPQIRFGQALVNLGIIKTVDIGFSNLASDPYYDKPEDILDRVKERTEHEETNTKS